MASNNKMKGLLKGLRYISEIFENEKEPEMKIGMPTDVKHVAHIGVDGPSATVKSAPSWLNEFKSAPANNGEVSEEDPVKWGSQDVVSREGPRAQSSSTINGKEECSVNEKSDIPKQSRKSSKSSSSKETSHTTTKHKKKPKDPNQGTDPPISEDTKKSSRRKKGKESADGPSRRSRTQDFDKGSESEERPSKASGFEEGES